MTNDKIGKRQECEISMLKVPTGKKLSEHKSEYLLRIVHCPSNCHIDLTEDELKAALKWVKDNK